MQYYLFWLVYLQVHTEQMPAEQWPVSNKCNLLTTFCLTNKYSNHPSTAPDLSLRLLRAF